jgi:hypothetical protein
MIKAHSLLYAIYICLIVSLLCGAILYLSNLYNQLNLYYNLQEELYIQNQSTLNFALGNKLLPAEIEKDEKSGIESSFQTKNYGLFTLVLSKSYISKDTIVSGHLTGILNSDKNAIYLTNLSQSLSYSGKLKIIGDSQLPSTFIETSYINNDLNQLTNEGKISISKPQLPEIRKDLKKNFIVTDSERIKLEDVEKLKDSLYYNSFFNATKDILVKPNLSNITFKGNFILRSSDSIRVSKNAILEDIILIAPKITFEGGFKGTVQAFATKGIELEEKVILNYPSVICVYNESTEDSKIKIKTDCKIYGAVVLFGSKNDLIDKNIIEIEENGVLFGDLYCSGKLMLKSNVYGSVYTNQFFLTTGSTSHENVISNIEINPTKLPDYFISISLFDTKKTNYGVIKKVL